VGWDRGVTKSQPFRTPQRKRLRKKTKRDAGKSDKYTIRRTINEFHITEGQHLTLKTLLPILNDQLIFQRKTRLDIGLSSEWKLQLK
jgi:hypothetical protein